MKNWIRIGIKKPDESSQKSDTSSKKGSNGSNKFQRYCPQETKESISKTLSKRSLNSLKHLAERDDGNASMEVGKTVPSGGLLGVAMTNSKMEFTHARRASEEPKASTFSTYKLKDIRTEMLRQNIQNDIRQLQQLCSEAKMLIKTMVTMFRRFCADASYNLTKINNLLGHQVHSQFRDISQTGAQLDELQNGLQRKYSKMSLKLPLDNLEKRSVYYPQEANSARVDSQRSGKGDQHSVEPQAELTRPRRAEQEGKQLTSVLLRMKNLLNRKP